MRKGREQSANVCMFFYMHVMFHIAIVALDIIVVLINTVVIKFMYCFRIFFPLPMQNRKKNTNFAPQR